MLQEKVPYEQAARAVPVVLKAVPKGQKLLEHGQVPEIRFNICGVLHEKCPDIEGDFWNVAPFPGLMISPKWRGSFAPADMSGFFRDSVQRRIPGGVPTCR